MYYLIDYDYSNKISLEWKRLPSINCSFCKNTWATSNFELVDNYNEQDQTGIILSNNEFNEFISVVGKKYSIDIEILLPGLKLGIPKINILDPIDLDIIMIFHGEILFRSKINKESNFFEAHSIKLNEDWHLLNINNFIKSNIIEIIECSHCLRKSYMYPEKIIIQDNKSGIFQLNNSNFIAVSDNVKELLSSYKHNILFQAF